MKLPSVPFSVPDWKALPGSSTPARRGTSFWRTVEAGGLRVRMVDYSPGLRGRPLVPRGHVVLVLEGEIIVRLKDGREERLAAGRSFQVSDDEANPHQVNSSPGGARLHRGLRQGKSTLRLGN